MVPYAKCTQEIILMRSLLLGTASSFPRRLWIAPHTALLAVPARCKDTAYEDVLQIVIPGNFEAIVPGPQCMTSVPPPGRRLVWKLCMPAILSMVLKHFLTMC